MLKGLEFKIQRIKLGIEGQEIANMIGVSQSYISKLENEKQSIPDHIYRKWINILKEMKKTE
jgi:predicted transcriptional regulator